MKVQGFKELLTTLAPLRGEKSIVFVHGMFDLLHEGHAKLLEKAKALGDILVVGVETDQNTKVLKGPGRPIHGQSSRVYVLSQLQTVDYIFLIPPYHPGQSLDDFYTSLYQQLQPSMIATCVSAGKHGKLKQTHANVLNIQFVDLDTRYEKTTSKIIEMLSNT